MAKEGKKQTAKKTTGKPKTAKAENKEKDWKTLSMILAVLLVGAFVTNGFGMWCKDAPATPNAAPTAPPAQNIPQAQPQAPGQAQPAQPAQPSAPATADPVVKLIVLNDKACKLCDPKRVVDITTQQVFPTAVVEEVDVSTARGKQLLQEFNVKVLPSFIFDASIEKAANFGQVVDALEQVGDSYMIIPAAAGSGKYLNPPTADDDPVKGDPNAPVTIIEFSEYECPFCGKFVQETLPDIVKNYIDTGKVKLVFRDFPLSFHANAQKAAEAAECADDQGKYWEYHDLLFDNQDDIGVDSLKKHAVTLGLDAGDFNNCLDTGKHTEEVLKDMADGAEFGVTGTPAFFINGFSISGAQPYEAFEQAIEAMLEESTA